MGRTTVKDRRGTKRKAERMTGKEEVKPWGTNGPPPAEWMAVESFWSVVEGR
jgi:hypothetical protein